jgi:hypothetical protein
MIFIAVNAATVFLFCSPEGFREPKSTCGIRGVVHSFKLTKACVDDIRLRNYAKDMADIFIRILAKITSITALQYMNKKITDPIGQIKQALC